MEEIIIAAGLLVLFAVLLLAMRYFTRLQYERRFRQWQHELEARHLAELEQGRKQAVSQSRAVLGGKFTEQMAPFLPEFRYDPTEARFIGTPIDFVVFPGLSRGEPEEIGVDLHLAVVQCLDSELSFRRRRCIQLLDLACSQMNFGKALGI